MSTLFIVHSQSDVAALKSHGIAATTNHADADGDSQVIILCNGNHSKPVAMALHGTVARLKVIDLHSSFTDWIAAEHTMDDLRSITQSTPDWKPEPLNHAEQLAHAKIKAFQDRSKSITAIMPEIEAMLLDAISVSEIRKHFIDKGVAVDIVSEAISCITDPDTGSIPTDEHLTELGNAKRLVHLFGDNIRFVPGIGWLTWDGNRWHNDTTGEIIRNAKSSIEAIYKEADTINLSECTTKDERKAAEIKREQLTKHALKSERDYCITAMLSLAESEPGVPVLASHLDKNPYQINCLNGTVCLLTGKLDPHTKTDMITRLIPIEFNPDAKAPLWLKFLSEIFPGQPDMISYLQRAVGYSMTGDVSEQNLFFLYGLGSNGKSVFINTIQHIFGDYYRKSPSTLILDKEKNEIPGDIAGLRGMRFVTCSELEEGKRMAESTVKDLCSTDDLTARFLYGNLFTFPPTHHLWIIGNHRPLIQGTDFAIWRRIHLVPFLQSFKPGDPRRDTHLESKLLYELPGILAWAVQGAVMWQSSGLQAPPAVVAAVQEYRTDMDSLGQWIDEFCTISGGLWSSTSDLYQSYVQWAKSSGYKVLAKRTFSNRLQERGFTSKKSGHLNTRGWDGICLKVDTSTMFDGTSDTE